MITLELFVEYLRDALEHLYDPDQLRRNPLIQLFNLSTQLDPTQELQSILSKAIELLEPREAVPMQTRAWRLYDLLVCRYLQQLSAHEVADQLGISRRHLRREQNAALETLSHRLWKQFELDARTEQGLASNFQATTLNPIATHSSTLEQSKPDATLDGELEWLRNLSFEQATELDETLNDVLELVELLANRNRVTITSQIVTDLSKPAVHPMAIRQLLLNLLTLAIENTPDGRLKLWVVQEEWDIRIGIEEMVSDTRGKSTSPEHATRQLIIEKMVNLIGARITFSTTAGAFGAVLTLPALEQLPVLVVDDNADLATLFQRYTKGTRYRLITEQVSTNAVRSAEQILPQIIVLDVMMPDADGWEILVRLRQNPLTRHIPIIVCSILAMEGLALSLGANACLKKPVTQSAFLAALDAQIEAPATESCQ